MAHEVVVDLFRKRPSLAAEVLDDVLGVKMPSYSEARIASIDLTQIQPAEYRADVVVTLHDDETASPVRVIIVEVQLATDNHKRLTLPVYVTVSRAVHGCPADLLVVAPDPSVASWCAEPIEIGVPGFVLRPPVLQKTAVPVITNEEEARRRPELGVLSVMAHGDSEAGAAIAAAVLPAVHDLDDDRVRFYTDLVYNSLNDAARMALETMMKGYEYQSDFAKKYIAMGRDQGSVEERAVAVLDALADRGLAVPEAVRDRVLAQKDPAVLRRWFRRAVTVSSAAEIFDDPS